MKQWPKKELIKYMSRRFDYTEENLDVARNVPEKMQYVLNGLIEYGLIVPLPEREEYHYVETGITVNNEPMYKRVRK